MNKGRFKYFKDSSNYLSATVVATAIGFFTLPVYTRFLTPSDFGIIALFIMFGSVTAGLVSFGLQAATYRYFFKYRDDIESFRVVNSNNIVFTLLVFGLFGVILWPQLEKVSFSIFDSQISPSLLKLSYFHGCIDYLLSYFMFIITAQTRSREYSSLKIAQIIINTLISFYMLYFLSFTYMARVYAFLFTKAFLVLVLLYLTRDLFAFKLSGPLFRESIKFSYPKVPQRIIALIYASFDKTMLTKYRGLDSVGYYNIGDKFAGIIKVVMDSIEKAWSPLFMKKAHEGSEAAKEVIVKSFFEIAFVFIFAGLGIIYFSEEMIRVLTTKDFYFAMYIVPVYVYYYLFGIIGMLAMNQISYSEKTLNLLPPSIASVTLNVVLNIILIKKYGAIGAVFATAIAAFMVSLLQFRIGNKVYPLPVSKKTLFGLFALAIAFTVPIYPVMASDLNFALKILIKIVLLASFVAIGLKTKLVSIDYIRSFFHEVMGRVSAQGR